LVKFQGHWDKNDNVRFEVLMVVTVKSVVTTDFLLGLLLDPENGSDLFL
jgi:hypothetical protein